jgi:hypothetical protein
MKSGVVNSTHGMISKPTACVVAAGAVEDIADFPIDDWLYAAQTTDKRTPINAIRDSLDMDVDTPYAVNDAMTVLTTTRRTTTAIIAATTQSVTL